MKRLIVVFLVMLIGAIPIIPDTASEAQSSSDAPYMYYFSDVLNSFVVERADGSDARLFGAGLMDPAPELISGPGWSPSGEWFAWIAQNGDFGHRVYEPFGLHVDGTRQITSLDEYTSALVSWSPVEDLLVASGYVGTPQVDEESGWVTTSLRVKLIDASTDSAIFSHDIADYVIGSGMEETAPIQTIRPPTIYWMADGQHFVVQSSNVTFGVNGTIAAGGIEYVYHVFDQSGSLHQITQLESEVISEASDGDNGLRSGKNFYAPIGDASTLVLVDLLANQTIEIATKDLEVFSVSFSSQGNRALLLAEEASCESDCPTSVWLWEDGQNELRLVEDYAEWDRLGGSGVWSPDGNRAIIHTEGYVPILVDFTTDSIGPIEGVPAATQWQWTGPSQVLLATAGDEGTVYDVILDTNAVEHVLIRRHLREIDEIGNISPDGSLFTYVGENPFITDVETGTEIALRPDGRSFFSLSGGETYWSLDSEWVLLAEEALLAGSSAPRWISIARRDGSMRRELGQHGSPTIVGWLPDRVDVAQLPSAQAERLFPMPDRALHGTDWSYVISWSPDGTQLVRGVTNFGPNSGPSTLFDVETGEVISEDLHVMRVGEDQVEWLQNEDGSYSPQIIHRLFEPWNGGDAVVAASPDGSRVGVYDNGTLSIYDTISEELLFSTERGGIGGASFTGDNGLVAISGAYQRTEIYDGETWELLVTLNTNGTAVAFSPDDQTLAVANSWDIELYAVEDLLAMAE